MSRKLRQTYIINLYGAPGAGKSTGAAYIFAKMKMMGISCELATEFAKDLCWENRKEAMENQIYLLGEQSFRISRLDDKVDFIINDSPVLLNALYPYAGWKKQAEDNICRLNLANSFNKSHYFNNSNSFNFVVKRNKSFDEDGRIHDKATSDKIHLSLIKMLETNGTAYKEILSDEAGYDTVIACVNKLIARKTTYRALNPREYIVYHGVHLKAEHRPMGCRYCYLFSEEKNGCICSNYERPNCGQGEDWKVHWVIDEEWKPEEVDLYN